MGKQRNQKNALISIVLGWFLFFSLQGCSLRKIDSTHLIIDKWVKQKYSKEAQLIITGDMNVSLPKIKAYRGAIIEKKVRKEGVFFVNTLDNSVNFFNATDLPQGGKP